VKKVELEIAAMPSITFRTPTISSMTPANSTQPPPVSSRPYSALEPRT
jgi:hypothetical protein